MKKILPLIALFVGIGFVASAQDNQATKDKERKHRGKFRQERVDKKTPEEIAQMRTERLDKKLNFSEEQRSDIYAYHLDQAKKFSARAEALKKQREERRQEMQADRDKFKDLLTAEQQELLASEMKAERKKISRERRGFRGMKDGERPMMRRKMEKRPAVEEDTNS